ncbi:MAG TPA: amidophosphoribosyltransferase, partial [bacterium]|nr:amidophosphoribosyltransferase [bacterium]
MKACSLIDKARCNCAVVGVYGTTEASRLAYLALYAQQHRGQESSGIVASDGRRVNRHVGRGLVADVFSDQALFATLGGHMAIGHNRYSTTGASHLVNAQPLVANFREGPFAVSHNGNFTNAGELRRRLEEQGSLFQTTTDTEVVLHLIARSRAQDMTARIAEALLQIEGAYSLVMMCNGRIYAARDPHGVRPLCLGHKEGSWFVASETCALDLLRAEIVRDIEPGELIEIH